MTTAHLADADLQLRNDVIRRLDADPQVDSTSIGVAAVDGTVTLTGFIDSYAGKLAAERTTKRVRGVRVVANDVEVRLRLPRTDPDIALEIARTLRGRNTVPESVQATVHHGRVTLTGTVCWSFAKEDAERLVRHIQGVRGVTNRITLLPRVTALDVRRRINEALHRDADVDASHIAVSVTDGSVILSGRVANRLQRESAERAAGAAPGVTTVDNRILVEPRRPDPGDVNLEIL